jgi:hypothetical protein
LLRITHKKYFSNQEARHNCEIERRNARNAAVDGTKEVPKADHLLTPPKQSKRKSAALETGDRAPKSSRKGPSGAVAKVGLTGRDKAKNP